MISFLSPDGDVSFAYDLIEPLLPSDMDEFSEYFTRNWIGTPTQTPRFPVALWNQFDAIDARLPRTTNLIEGWHNGFKVLVNKRKPTIIQFIDALKADIKTDIKMTKMHARTTSTQTKQKMVLP